jgi:hypothetical protein
MCPTTVVCAFEVTRKLLVSIHMRNLSLEYQNLPIVSLPLLRTLIKHLTPVNRLKMFL